MNLTRFEKRENRKGTVLVSIAVHVIVIALIASITFKYPITSLFGPREIAPTERVIYVKPEPAAPAPRQVAKGVENAKAKKAPIPAPLIAPSVIPTTIPPVPIAPPQTGSPTGTVTGTAGSPTGIATGIAPELPDPRIELKPNMLRLPMTQAQRNDSAIKAIYMAYREAEIDAAAHAGRSPRDWTFEKNGQKYGLDSSYIYLGKFKLPSAILAALPFNYGGVDGRRIIDGRNADWIRNDIYAHSQGMSEDDFRAAIKRIRERKDKEKKEAEEAKARSSGIVP
jgi:hypothetical protein